MPRASHKTARLIGDRIGRGVNKGTERIVSHVGPVGIHVELGPRRGVLEIVAAALLGHPGALDIGRESVAMVLTEPLPSVLIGVQPDQFLGLPLIRQAARRIELDSVQRIHVG